MGRKPTTEGRRRTWIEADARTLDARLRRGDLPRAERAAARALLGAAFDALGAGEAPDDLVRALDAAAHPAPEPGAAAWVGRRTLSAVVPLGVVDFGWVDGLVARADVADAIQRRVDRFLEVTGAAALGPTQRTSVAEAPALDFDLTRG
ncbi:MAG: hypothetical protein H6704_16080 [Myxococcales bacterium]|nr:hypothetical protein [Myxococcales bacterium]